MDRVSNVNLRFEDYKNNSYLTHNYHPYPAKFIPQLPAELISILSQPGDLILDPFMGSGTTLVEAKLLGRNGVGSDINPLSCLVSRVKTTVLTVSETTEAQKYTLAAGEEVRSGVIHEAPSFQGIDKWFSKQAKVELAAILSVIRQVRSVRVREFLEVAFSSIIVRASKQDSDTRYKAIEKHLEPFRIAEFFSSRVCDMVQRMDQFRALAKPNECSVFLEDATESIPGSSLFHLAVTSPPYMNSYDYYLYHKHRMNWLGMDYRSAQEAEFGSRNKHNDKNLGVEAYNLPILNNAKLVFERLRKDGHYCIVIGDAILKGKLVTMNTNFDAILTSVGFKKIREIAFPQRKYTKTFTPGLRAVFKNSYVLIYRRVA